jgi:arabinogalactan endo-1,4-beta-galactosidase
LSCFFRCRAAAIAVSLLILSGCSSGDDAGKPLPPAEIRAVDLSFLPAMEAAGVVYRDDQGNPGDALMLLRNAGVTMIRLRLWHTPAASDSSLAEVKAFSSRIRDAGMKTWITLHYSDTWADPAHQYKPAAWEGLSVAELIAAVEDYTLAVIQELEPDILQIGNEINNGILWPEGSAADRDTFRALLSAGIRGARAGRPETELMIHYAGHENAADFMSWLDIDDYDIVGLSYYPLWHGKSLEALAQSVTRILDNTGKSVVIAETAYPFDLGWNDDMSNVCGSVDQLIESYPATPTGQRNFLHSLRRAGAAGGSRGFCYWGGEWVAWDGVAGGIVGSSWENMALFDYEGRMLPASSSFSDR